MIHKHKNDAIAFHHQGESHTHTVVANERATISSTSTHRIPCILHSLFFSSPCIPFSVFFFLSSHSSQKQPVVVRAAPELQFDTDYAKRKKRIAASKKGVPSATPATAEELQTEAKAWREEILAQENGEATWARIKQVRRFYLETGVVPVGWSNYAMHSTYRPILEHRMREDWDPTEVIRDVRVPRL